MRHIHLDDVKQQLNIELGYTGDDRYILNLIEAAEDAVSKHLNMDFSKCFVDENEIPTSIKQQIKILIATWYNNREGVGSGHELPLSYGYLAGLNRNYDDDSFYAIKNRVE